MASRTIVLLEDDVDGSKADETIEFGIDGTTYAIDLSDSNAKRLRGALDGYISKARPQSGPCLGCLQWHRAVQPRAGTSLGAAAVPERRLLRLA